MTAAEPRELRCAASLRLKSSAIADKPILDRLVNVGGHRSSISRDLPQLPGEERLANTCIAMDVEPKPTSLVVNGKPEVLPVLDHLCLAADEPALEEGWDSRDEGGKAVSGGGQAVRLRGISRPSRHLKRCLTTQSDKAPPAPVEVPMANLSRDLSVPISAGYRSADRCARYISASVDIRPGSGSRRRG
jgi:hypothetical protein